MRKTITAALIAAAAMFAGASTASAQSVPMVKYWNQGVTEDAIQWCETHAYISGVRIYGCLYNNPSCAWAGVPYPPTRGTCAIKWTMWPYTGSQGRHNAKFCIGSAHYVYTRNVTAFLVHCYPLRWISAPLRAGAASANLKTEAVRHLTAKCLQLTKVPYRCTGVALDGRTGFWAAPGGGRWFGGYFATNGRTYRCTAYVRNSGVSGGVYC